MSSARSVAGPQGGGGGGTSVHRELLRTLKSRARPSVTTVATAGLACGGAGSAGRGGGPPRAPLGDVSNVRRTHTDGGGRPASRGGAARDTGQAAAVTVPSAAEASGGAEDLDLMPLPRAAAAHLASHPITSNLGAAAAEGADGARWDVADTRSADAGRGDAQVRAVAAADGWDSVSWELRPAFPRPAPPAPPPPHAPAATRRASSSPPPRTSVRAPIELAPLPPPPPPAAAAATAARCRALSFLARDVAAARSAHARLRMWAGALLSDARAGVASLSSLALSRVADAEAELRRGAAAADAGAASAREGAAREAAGARRIGELEAAVREERAMSRQRACAACRAVRACTVWRARGHFVPMCTAARAPMCTAARAPMCTAARVPVVQ